MATREAASQKKMLQRSKYRLHAAPAKAILLLADALRRTAFLDVSSLNFGGATSTAVFLQQASFCQLVAPSSESAPGQSDTEMKNARSPGRQSR
jgi:hypothetical protein